MTDAPDPIARPDALGAILGTLPPQVSADQAVDLAARHFGVTGAATALVSERDLNFRLEGPEGRFVLKFANPAEAVEVTRFQSGALIHLETHAPGLPVPRVRRTGDGAADVMLPGVGLFRCLTWLEGQPLHAAPRSAALRRALGATAAGLTTGLRGFSHPGAGHELQWDIRHAARLRPLLPAVAEPALRELVTRVLDIFEADLAPRLPDCRWQVVHNDLNPHNVLVDPADPTRISGVLDFGDMVKTALVCDLAIAASYQIDPAAPLQSLSEVVEGYSALHPLTALELALVPGLTATRMVTTIAIASWRAACYPDNAPYILRNLPVSRAGLAALAAVPPGDLASVFGRLPAP